MSDLYVITQPSASLVKIGRSRNVERRLSSLASQSGTTMRLVRVIPACGDLERAVHSRLSAYRQLGEWFTDEGEVRTFVDRVRSRSDVEAWIASHLVPEPAALRPRGWTKGKNGWSRSFGSRGRRVRVYQLRPGGCFYRAVWIARRGKDRRSLATRDRQKAAMLANQLLRALATLDAGE